MNNLEKEILGTIKNLTLDDSNLGKLNKIVIAQAAAEVAMKWAIQKFKEYSEYRNDFEQCGDSPKEFEEWLELNGLTPTEPDTKEQKQ